MALLGALACAMFGILVAHTIRQDVAEAAIGCVRELPLDKSSAERAKALRDCERAARNAFGFWDCVATFGLLGFIGTGMAYAAGRGEANRRNDLLKGGGSRRGE
jgi:hypothetical protein